MVVRSEPDAAGSLVPAGGLTPTRLQMDGAGGVKAYNGSMDCASKLVKAEGPGALFKPFIIMEELLDKLKLLDYEREFTLEMRMRPLNRHYFVLQTNPGEQFFVFSSLAAWLIRKTGKNFESPQEFDDPNSTIANILDHVRRLGVTIDFAPSKLKQGYGSIHLFI